MARRIVKASWARRAWGKRDVQVWSEQEVRVQGGGGEPVHALDS